MLYVNYLLKRLQISHKGLLSLKSPKYNIEHILWGVRLEKAPISIKYLRATSSVQIFARSQMLPSQSSTQL